MAFQYKVDTFVPKIEGCGSQDLGWDRTRCGQFEAFLNGYSNQGWRLHSCEYREVTATAGCGASKGAWLVCVFEKTA